MPAPEPTRRAKKDASASPSPAHPASRELVILTGLSGAGKGSALKAFEDLGFYAVDNLPIELVPRFAELVAQSVEITRATLVVDVREGQSLAGSPTDPPDHRRLP